jgi:membrane protease YdiL (CAAX protease family)
MSAKDEAFPSVPQALLLVVALFVAEMIVGMVLYDFKGGLGLSPNAVSAMTVLLGNGLVISVILHAKGMGYRSLFHPTSSSVLATLALTVLPLVLITPALVLLNGTVVDWLVQQVPLSEWEASSFSRMSDGTLPSMVAVCLLAPVVEEMLFRGIILRAFLHRYPRGLAMAWSAMLFGVAHLNLYQFLVATGLGWLLAWLYERTRSLYPCVALHVVYNSVVTLFGIDALTDSRGMWTVALFLAAVGALGLWGTLGRRVGSST